MGTVTGYKDKLYFSLPYTELGTELWVSDGTQEGTTIFNEFKQGSGASNPRIRGVLNDHLTFEATDNKGRKLWRTFGMFIRH